MYCFTVLEVKSLQWVYRAKIKESAGLCLFWRFQGRIHSLTFPVPRAYLHSLAQGLIFPTSASIVAGPRTEILPPSSQKDPCDHIRHVQIILKMISTSQDPFFDYSNIFTGSGDQTLDALWEREMILPIIAIKGRRDTGCNLEYDE